MNYKRSLQIAFSKKEKSEKQLKKLETFEAADEDESVYIRNTQEKHKKNLLESKNEILEIKQKIDDEIAEKKEILLQYTKEYNNLNTALKVGEITQEESDKKVDRIKKKFEKDNEKLAELTLLKKSTSSGDVGGFIDPDKAKNPLLDQIKGILKI